VPLSRLFLFSPFIGRCIPHARMRCASQSVPLLFTLLLALGGILPVFSATAPDMIYSLSPESIPFTTLSTVNLKSGYAGQCLFTRALTCPATCTSSYFVVSSSSSFQTITIPSNPGQYRICCVSSTNSDCVLQNLQLSIISMRMRLSIHCMCLLMWLF
jgi:hypothetical protein